MILCLKEKLSFVDASFHGIVDQMLEGVVMAHVRERLVDCISGQRKEVDKERIATKATLTMRERWLKHREAGQSVFRSEATGAGRARAGRVTGSKGGRTA